VKWLGPIEFRSRLRREGMRFGGSMTLTVAGANCEDRGIALFRGLDGCNWMQMRVVFLRDVPIRMIFEQRRSNKTYNGAG